MKRILFVCHGNICRSPMAEYIMKDIVRKAGCQDEYYIASAATSTEEIGNSIYPPAKQKLAEYGIKVSSHAARQVVRADYQNFDLIICMDRMNIRNLARIFPEDPEHKVKLLMDYTDRTKGTEVADPWYTGNFDSTWRDCYEGCTALFEAL